MLRSCRLPVEPVVGLLAPPSVNVNLTTRDLRDPEFVERVLHALDSAGLPPSCLPRPARTCWLSRSFDTAGEFLSVETSRSKPPRRGLPTASISRCRGAAGTPPESHSDFASSISFGEWGSDP